MNFRRLSIGCLFFVFWISFYAQTEDKKISITPKVELINTTSSLILKNEHVSMLGLEIGTKYVPKVSLNFYGGAFRQYNDKVWASLPHHSSLIGVDFEYVSAPHGELEHGLCYGRRMEIRVIKDSIFLVKQHSFDLHINMETLLITTFSLLGVFIPAETFQLDYPSEQSIPSLPSS